MALGHEADDDKGRRLRCKTPAVVVNGGSTVAGDDRRSGVSGFSDREKLW